MIIAHVAHFHIYFIL